ncbi:hypothetical protein EOL96_02780 [Candidatus Saccharibacteria bacterium]|nr:hypothetical protein [Candidatus Saccharibacteria bacterium]
MPPNNQQPVNQTQPQPAPAGNFGATEQQFQPPIGSSPVPTATTPVTASAPNVAKRGTSTQNSLLLSEIRDGMIIMADGSFRAIVACKSINFDLMSSREREGVEFSYQNFLNALYFPIQIFIRSQRVDIGPYLDKLEQIRRSQDNMLLSVLMDDYIQFIDILAQEANIMDKSFFVVVPYYPAGDVNTVVDQGKGFFGKIFGGGTTQTTVTKIDKVMYEKAKDEIRNRVDSVISGLTQVGVHAVQLSTKELGELYYNVYNPDTAVREPLGNFDGVTSMYVRKGQTDTSQTSQGAA